MKPCHTCGCIPKVPQAEIALAKTLLDIVADAADDEGDPIFEDSSRENPTDNHFTVTNSVGTFIVTVKAEP